MERIDPHELNDLLTRERVILLDVRRREAWGADPARLPGAIWLPLEEVPRRAADLPREARLVVYCS